MNNPKSGWFVFWLSFLPIVLAEVARMTTGAYDTLSIAKAIGVAVLALGNGALAGLIALNALHSEPKPPASNDQPN